LVLAQSPLTGWFIRLRERCSQREIIPHFNLPPRLIY
jgi:hypothetical protein